MKKNWLIFLALLWAVPSFAHRLNEYLQATTITLSRDKVRLQMRLTPGTAIAVKLLQTIDANGDGAISLTEQRNYLGQIEHDLSLTIDGRYTALEAQAFIFPAPEAMKKGVGDVIVSYEAALDTKNVAHQLIFKDQHYKNMAVYLVNCLLPADTTLKVTGQTRSNDQSVYQLDFTSGKTSDPVVGNDDHWAAVKTYFVHGIKHILTGYDHLLFLCALVLGAASLWDLIKIVTAFTIAHSITLTLATFGLAHLPEQLVEPMIAASIVFVAIQNIAWPKQANGNIRLAVAFFFGLFHGLGFAGGLLELMHAMPTAMIWFAILGFSLGVEAGNQLVLLPLYGSMRLFDRSRITNFQRYASAAVAIAGIYYLVTDLAAWF